MFSLGARLATLSFLVLALVSGAVGFGIHNRTADLLTERALEEVDHQGDMVKRRFQATLSNARKELELFTRLPPIPAIADGAVKGPHGLQAPTIWKQRLETIWTGFLETDLNYLEVRFITLGNDGRELVNVQRRPDGTVRSVPVDALQPTNSEDFSQQAAEIESVGIYISPIDLKRAQGRVVEPPQLIMRLMTPVRGANDLFGLIVVTLDAGRLLDDLSHSVPTDYNVFLSNERGELLIHPDPQKAVGSTTGPPLRLTEAIPALQELMIEKTAAPFHRFIGEEAIHFERIGFNPFQPERFFGLLLTTSASAILGDVILAERENTLRLIVGLLAGAVLILLFARRLTHPLRDITRAAADFQLGG